MTSFAIDSIGIVLRGTLIAASPDIHAHTLEIDAARARVAMAGRAEPAALTAETEGVRGGDVAHAQSVRVQLERDFVPRALRAALRGVAETEAQEAEAARLVAEQRLAATIDRSLVALLGWTAIGRRLSAEDTLLASAEGSLRSRFAVGDARYVDVLRMRTERLRVQGERATSVTNALLSRRALEGLAVGDSIAAIVHLLLDRAMVIDLPQALLASIPETPDVDAIFARSGQRALADAPVARAQAERQRIVALQRPQLRAFVGLQRFADDRGYPVGSVLGATVSLPFTARAARSAQSNSADRSVDAAMARRRATIAALRTMLLAARDRVEAARLRMAGYDAALLRGAREERESALASYRAGQLSLVELLDFERALARAEIERLRSRIDAADALADLFSAGAPAESATSLRSSSNDDR